ncbi:hypothetical protein [Mycobacterium sp.]|uniref:hypothetical protein n=1 Tax=Mycobacterium sp. TaxID=1785 RepID=UPI003C789C29
MTTQEHQNLTGSPDEAQVAAPETPPVGERVEPVEVPVSDDTANVAPTGGEERAQAPVAPAEPTDVTPERESSTEEMLFADADLTEMRGRWSAVQAAFVDDPKDCVQKADVLVSDLVEQLTSSFARARSSLEEQWARGEEASTEDLRLALMHYREFFERLLAV